MKSFEYPKSIRNYKKKSLERQTLSGRVICPSEPAYYIVDCRILKIAYWRRYSFPKTGFPFFRQAPFLRRYLYRSSTY